MATRLSGITLPNKRIQIALTYIYGIGKTQSTTILEKLKINIDKRADDLTENEITAIKAEIDKFPHEGDLKRRVQSDLKRLQEINCYRGRRHSLRLPCRGQKTKVNARTRRGKKSTIANKKK